MNADRVTRRIATPLSDTPWLRYVEITASGTPRDQGSVTITVALQGCAPSTVVLQDIVWHADQRLCGPECAAEA